MTNVSEPITANPELMRDVANRPVEAMIQRSNASRFDRVIARFPAEVGSGSASVRAFFVEQN